MTQLQDPPSQTPARPDKVSAPPLPDPRPLDAAAFRRPNRDFGILPFWFLNGELDPDEMRYQLGELRAKGMQGVVLHGRFGLEMPYGAIAGGRPAHEEQCRTIKASQVRLFLDVDGH